MSNENETGRARTLPIPRRKREVRLNLPPSMRPKKEQITEEEWLADQKRKQDQAVANHEAHLKRQRAERAEEDRLRAATGGKSLREKLDGVDDRMPLPPDAQNAREERAYARRQKQFEPGKIPMRGPKLRGNGLYEADGEVPVRRDRRKGGSRVAQSKGRVAAARRVRNGP
jgi:hypothetical protein